jgi:hypothetical protein
MTELDIARNAVAIRNLAALAEELSDRQIKAIVKGSQYPDGSYQRAKEVGRSIGYAIAARMIREALAGVPTDREVAPGVKRLPIKRSPRTGRKQS